MQDKKTENGETENPLHIRMNGHRSDINTRKLDKPVAAHFNQPDHSLNDLRVMGIEKIHTNSGQWRKQRESYWIFTLDTMTPKGMNLDEGPDRTETSHVLLLCNI